MLNSHFQENGKSRSVVLSKTNEQSFEALIEKSLVGSTIEERKATGLTDVNADGGYKTSYIWEHILQKDTIADIIMNYVLFDYGEAKPQKKVLHIMRNAKTLLFPRYHQLLSRVSTVRHPTARRKNSSAWLNLLGSIAKTKDSNTVSSM